MNRQNAYERRVWRLAHLLASPDQAIPLVRRLIWRRGGDLDRLDPAHLDRLVILTARDLPRPSVARGATASPEGQAVPARPPPLLATDLLRRLHAMPRQPMEAWVLSRLDNLDLMAASRAMDCSKTATARHLEAADEHLRQGFASETGGQEKPGVEKLAAATDALRNWLDALDPAPALARAHKQARIQRKTRLALIVLGAIAFTAVLAYALR